MEEITKIKENLNGITGLKSSGFNNEYILWPNNITEINLSGKNIKSYLEFIKLPENLIALDISYNGLDTVPDIIMTLSRLECLNLAYNNVKTFEECPKFVKTLKYLNLSDNYLEQPPSWIWLNKPEKLKHLILSNNRNLFSLLSESLLHLKIMVEIIELANCSIGKESIQILVTFPAMRELVLGTTEYNILAHNLVDNIPSYSLLQCCDIVKLNLSNCRLSCLNKNIDIYTCLKEINLSMNSIRWIPDEFCNLKQLETCVLSYNQIIMLPENFCKLVNLKNLHLDRNEICALPDGFCDHLQLRLLDLYNNCLYELPDDLDNIQQIDLARNFVEEPDDTAYREKKICLRSELDEYRADGKREEEPDKSSCFSEDEDSLNEDCDYDNSEGYVPENCSSEEDWDSDEYWEPGPRNFQPNPGAVWAAYARRKVADGNFCPIDLHTEPIVNIVKYDADLDYVTDGQFDDLSEDDVL